MNLNAAIKRADRLSNASGREYFVVWEPEEGETRETGYHTTDDLGLETTWAGAPIKYSTWDGGDRCY